MLPALQPLTSVPWKLRSIPVEVKKSTKRHVVGAANARARAPVQMRRTAPLAGTTASTGCAAKHSRLREHGDCAAVVRRLAIADCAAKYRKTGCLRGRNRLRTYSVRGEARA